MPLELDKDTLFNHLQKDSKVISSNFSDKFMLDFPELYGSLMN